MPGSGEHRPWGCGPPRAVRDCDAKGASFRPGNYREDSVTLWGRIGLAEGRAFHSGSVCGKLTGMTPDQIVKWNADLSERSPLEITRWAIAHADGRAMVSTNFRPYEAAILHLAVQAQPRIPVLWVDHGYNRPATYRHAEQLRALLHLDIRAYLPRIT